jgi:hypothetical protein
VPKASVEMLVNKQPGADVDVVLLCEGHLMEIKSSCNRL